MDNDELMTLIVDGHTIETRRRALDTGEILVLAGMLDGMVIRVDGGRASHFEPDTVVEFDEATTPAFRTFHLGPIRHFRVDDLLWDWGAPAITEDDVRQISGHGDDVTVHLRGRPEPIRHGRIIDLTGPWPPHLEIRDVPPFAALGSAMVPVTVNGRSVTLERPEVSFEYLVRVAFPGADTASPSSRALTVTYRHGPPARPEGSLVSREKVQVKNGEIFSVTATDKS